MVGKDFSLEDESTLLMKEHYAYLYRLTLVYNFQIIVIYSVRLPSTSSVIIPILHSDLLINEKMPVQLLLYKFRCSPGVASCCVIAATDEKPFIF